MAASELWEVLPFLNQMKGGAGKGLALKEAAEVWMANDYPEQGTDDNHKPSHVCTPQTP